MIVIKVELHSAITGKVTELGRAVIANDGTGTARSGNYFAAVLRKGANPAAGVSRQIVRKGRVMGYARQSYPIWRLVIRALRACYPEEK